MQKVSIIMPVYNGETTLEKTLESLLNQEINFLEIIIVNDASTDKSLEIIKEFISENGKCKLINNQKNLGLAKSYNIGIKAGRGDLIVTMHQDIVLAKDALEKLVAPLENEKVVAAGHADLHPLELWKKYNFWQKCYFSRFQKLNITSINGQFDCFRKKALEKVGLFDEVHFHSAGEDGDIVYKLKKIGKIADSEAKIIHLHKIDPNFNWKNIIRKQAQYSEAQGALLSLGRISGFKNYIKTFFREIMLLSLFFPYLNTIVLVSIIIYSFIYTERVYREEYNNPRIFVLPFFNIYLLFISFIFSTRGFISKKQVV
jgi:glycosyltransferase involved in cell wall biosynthesis